MTSDLKSWQACAYGGLILTMFFCVVLHEFGHALTAKRFGIQTKDIILSPIGGVARLHKMPDQPLHEFYITIAGPLVNLVIGSLVGIIMYYVTGHFSLSVDTYNFNEPLEFVRFIAPINLTLFMFNLIPAFPMDGGRILRSLLALKIGKIKATKLASLVGKTLAVGFIVFGIFNQQVILSLIGLFIFMMAGKEYDQTKIADILSKTYVKEILRSHFTRFHTSDPYTRIIEAYYQQGEHYFLVFDSLGKICGNIPKSFIKDTIKNQTTEKTADQMMSDKYAVVSPNQTLAEAIQIMRNQGCSIVAVEDNEILIGVLDKENIEDYIQLKTS